MDWQNEKCVMVIDESLPLGIIANTAAIMGITLGKKMPEVVGADNGAQLRIGAGRQYQPAHPYCPPPPGLYRRHYHQPQL